MAKRGAEALACPARFRSYFPHAPLPKRSRSDLEWRESPRSGVLRCEGGCKKRKRVTMAGGEDGEDTAGNKRPAGPEGGGAQKEAARGLFPEGAAPESEPLSRLSPEAAAASGDHLNRCVAPKRPDEHEDDAWHYNSFQYWRSPLPAIDLCDILDLEKDVLEAGDSSNIAFSEMET